MWVLTSGNIRVNYKAIGMSEKIAVPVSVNLVFDSSKRIVFPKTVIWNRRVYKITKLGLHHTYRSGRTLFHVFSVLSDRLFFRLVLNTETLHWCLEELSDGMLE